MADYTGLMELNGDLKLSLTSLVRFADDPSQGNKVLAWLLSHLFDYNAVPLDKEFFDSLRSVKDVGNIAGMVPPVGQFHASNNWAVSSKRSATGNAIYSSDPHLRVDLLPAVVGEFIAVLPDNFVAGFSLVGGPAIIISRSKYVSMGLTYGMQDSTDIFLEQCEGSSCRDGDEMVPIKFREELFPQKGGSLVKIFMPHTKNGLINLGQQHHPLAHNLSSPPVLEKGSYFTYMFPYWIPHKSTWGLSVQKILNARTVSEMAEYLRTLDIGANWLVVDNSGHIAYQQSGFVGKRDFIGLPVRPGWDSRFAWRGFFEQSALHSIVDPPDGILVTANNMISDPNGQRLISYDLGPFRAGRIREELNKKEKLTIEDMKTEQGDTFSLLCSDLMGIARPVIPADTQDPNLRALLDFDCRFRRGSQGATVFVYFLREVWALALSPLGGNAAVWSDITSKVTSRPLMHRLVMEFPAELDEALWHGQTRQQLLGKALNITAALFSGKPARPYVARYKAKNTVFMGTLPSWLGFDRMVEAEGCQDSPGAVYFDTVTADENSKAVAACLRFVADMSQDETYESIVSGGPSGRPFSPWYSSELTRWQNFKTKVVNITAAIASTAVKQKAEV
jgi:penicillin amidase